MTRPATVVYVGMSLDGFIARPDGGIDWLDPSGGAGDGANRKSTGENGRAEDYGWTEFLGSIDAMIMGRKTFEQVMGFGMWPYGSLPVIVLSTSLASLPENAPAETELSSLSPETLLAQLGERGRKRVYVDGGRTVQSFMRADLIDELVLTTLPVLIGEGLPLFGPLEQDLYWEYLSTKTFPGGLVRSHYRRKR